ncbi:MAG: delta-lactam-biosynthetic de-N-acetylase [Clostridia bacterium]|nr:delta-lactam-biosynthetic de-N-acetylase [Clostridia bacterium]
MVIVIKKKQIIMASIFFALIFSAFFMHNLLSSKILQTESFTSSNWGLSFKKNNPIPTGNTSAENLKNFNAYYLGDTSAKRIYLTFDAGYENGYTAGILDILKENNVKATFFLVGNYLKTSPDLVKRMLSEGHLVGNHTFNHPDMSKISDPEAFKEEIESLENLYKEVTGHEMKKLYRPPQGKYNEENLKMANDLGYKTFFWSLAYVDWIAEKQPTHEQAFKKLSRIHPGAIVLLHSTSKTNSEILNDLIKKWKEEGYEFGSLEEF